MKTQYEAMMENPEFRKQVTVETVVAEAAEVVARLMAEKGVSKAELARMMGKSRAWVTQLLSGQANMTVRTLAEVVYTLDAEVKLETVAPSWKQAAKPRGEAAAPVVFQSGQFTLSGAPASEKMFRLSTTPEMAATHEEIAETGSDDGLKRPEYAA